MKNLPLPLPLPFALLIVATLLFTAAVESTPAAASPAASPAPSPTLSRSGRFGFGFGCDDKCWKRCANAGYKERCLKYCGICCGKCEGCVPSSPYADKAECPCYRDLKNSKGKPKCP